MTDILARIVEHKRGEIEQARRGMPLASVRASVADSPPVRDFFAAMTQPAGELRVLAEVKRASPSAGLIREDFDPVVLAKAYRDHGAAAISCLTDEHFFQGSLDYLKQIRAAIDLPLLRKDFIISPYQIYEARAAGADAVLLIAECLTRDELYALHGLAGELGLACLVEIFEPTHLDLVQQLLVDQPDTPSLLGINNRDLKAMVTDLDHTLNLLSQVTNRDILVSESGIRSGQDVARLRSQGVHRILIGEHLMRQPDVGDALSEIITNSQVF